MTRYQLIAPIRFAGSQAHPIRPTEADVRGCGRNDPARPRCCAPCRIRRRLLNARATGPCAAVLPSHSASRHCVDSNNSIHIKSCRLMSTTAEIAAPLGGNKLYQERARAALPLLVRQAAAAKPIFYSALAEELGMPNPRNLNYVLGSIGQAMVRLSKQWKATVPPIQCLVVNKVTGIPGEGIGWFLITKEEFAKLPLRRRREIVQAELQLIYAYPHWDEVLKELELTRSRRTSLTMLQKPLVVLAGAKAPLTSV
jgi:hypothetical protein